MLLRFLVLSFGFAFTHRMIEFQITRKPLSEAVSAKIAKIQILFFWILTVLSPWIPVLVLVLLLFVPNLAATRLDWIFNFILRHQFRLNLLKFVDEIILLMMTGKSFRDSYLQLTANAKDFFHIKMRELLLVANFQSDSHLARTPEVQQIAHLVQVIEKNPHKAIEKLRALRRQLHWSLLFRRKAKLATVQIRAQAIVLSLLYVGLLIFVLRNQGLQAHSVVLPSMILFFSGLLTLLLIGRKQKWKT